MGRSDKGPKGSKGGKKSKPDSQSKAPSDAAAAVPAPAPALYENGQPVRRGLPNQFAPKPVRPLKKKTLYSGTIPPIPDPQLLDLIHNFFTDFKYVKAAHGMRTENQKRPGHNMHTDWKWSSEGMPDLLTLFHQWQVQNPGKTPVRKSRQQMMDEAKGLAAESSQQVLGMTEQDELSDQDASLSKALTPSSATLAATSDTSSDIDSDSEGSTDSDSDSSSDDSSADSLEGVVVSKKAKKSALKVNGNGTHEQNGDITSSDSSSSSSSDGSDSDSDSDISSSDVSSDTTDSSDSSDSDDEKVEIPKPKKLAKSSKVAKFTPSSSDSSSESSDSSSDSSDSEAEAPAEPPKPIQAPQTNGKAKRKHEDIFADASATKKTKKEVVPFSRIPDNVAVDERFSSNNYVPYDYANRAHEKLIITKGKEFTKAKNKGKRGSYRGGMIDTTVRGIRFDD